MVHEITDCEFFMKPILFLKSQKSLSNLLSESSSVPQRFYISLCEEDKKLILKLESFFKDEWMLESLLMQTRIEGGSNDNDVTDETVIAWFSLVLSSYVDTTHTG